MRALTDKTTELLKPHQSGHPITYNHYFTETLQNVRNEWAKDDYTRIIQDFFGVQSLNSVYRSEYMDLRPLVTALLQRREPDMNRLACSEALDCMQGYYKVALKRLIDDVAVEAVEAELISKLQDIFSPITVASMCSDIVVAVAGESEENRAQRGQLTKQLDVLTKGSEICKRFIVVGEPDSDDGKTQIGYRFAAAQRESREFDERSDDPGDENTPSTPGRQPSEESEPLSNETTGYSSSPIVIGPPMAEPETLEVETPSHRKRDRKRGKSKIATKRALFEDDGF